MSSVELKTSKVVFKNILLRQGSIDKIKCSAYATLGSIYSRKFTVKNILEDAMNSSRTYIQVPVITLIMPSIHIFCVTMSILMKLIRNRNFIVGLSFEKLDRFIIEFNQLKAKSKDAEYKSERQTEKAEVDRVKMIESTPEIDFDVKNNNNNSIIFHSKNSSTQTEQRTDRFLKIASYLSIIFVHAQFTLLLYLVGLSTIKLGMMFMFACLAVIGYLIIKISLSDEVKSSHPSRRCSRRMKAVKQKLFGKAMNLGPITCVLPQIKFNTCAGKFPMEKQKSL